MNETERRERRAEIEAAAFELLQEVGYRKTSMLQIAKRARASNQTLYSWYQNKQDLFRSIIEDNGRAVREHLEAALAGGGDPRRALAGLGPVLLRFTTDRKAVIINRAAVIDAAETGVLARAIDEVGRDSLYPLIRSLMQRLIDTRCFDARADADVAAQTYVALLFGEAQLRLALGTIAPYDEQTIREQSRRAYELTCRLFDSVVGATAPR
ncbi:MAG: TetR/AcrR family transcriptional regulator [Burkholderiaceae bacterium]